MKSGLHVIRLVLIKRDGFNILTIDASRRRIFIQALASRQTECYIWMLSGLSVDKSSNSDFIYPRFSVYRSSAPMPDLHGSIVPLGHAVSQPPNWMKPRFTASSTGKLPAARTAFPSPVPRANPVRFPGRTRTGDRFGCADHRRRVPFVPGTGSNNLEETLHLSRHASRPGADAVLVIVPYYVRPSQEGLFRYFRRSPGSVDIPVILYNIPGRTAVNLEVDDRRPAARSLPEYRRGEGVQQGLRAHQSPVIYSRA